MAWRSQPRPPEDGLRYPLVIRLALALATAALGPARAEGPRALGLREAVALAVRNNPTLATAVVDVAIADAGVLAARGADDFVWDAAGTWTRSRHEVVPGTPVQQSRGDHGSFSTALSRPLPTGGSVGLRLSMELVRERYLSYLGPQPELSTYDAGVPALRLFVAHPLLRGAGVEVARAQRRRASVARDVAGLERAATAANVVRDVVVAYWQTHLASEELAIHRALSESARQQLLAVEASIDAGKLPRSASAEVKVALALRQDDALAAEALLTGQSLELARLVGLEAPFLATTDRPDFTPQPVAAALETALASNPQLLALRAKERAAGIEVDVSRSEMLPQLDVALSAGTEGNASDTALAFRQLRTARSYDVQVALVFAEPIGRHAAKGALAAARAAADRAHLTTVELAGQIRAAALRQAATIDAGARRIAALADTTAVASLDLAAERARFEVGRATNFDVLRRQDELAQARLHELHARIDYLRARAELDALTGDILSHHGVTIR